VLFKKLIKHTQDQLDLTIIKRQSLNKEPSVSPKPAIKSAVANIHPKHCPEHHGPTLPSCHPAGPQHNVVKLLPEPQLSNPGTATEAATTQAPDLQHGSHHPQRSPPIELRLPPLSLLDPPRSPQHRNPTRSCST
jgi:hypothetical protein